jgi:DnaK suppressor protein
MQRESLRQTLLTGQTELQRRLDAIDKDFSGRTISKQFDEQSIERENDDVLRGLTAEAREQLQLTEIALRRIDSDDFDHCVECAETISDARLEAIPHAQTCRKCAV